ncbi:MAG: molybdopterin molybdotransferase MoeA [Rhodopseudomonas sp.]|uniref:molybdopterin molybdotransferase MoeA n=1 Tax=Rhodopseudomonas sp. TaxID=1078 RepID=UPI001858DCB1|nr:gephyrin-like molybdotransferase Glp [Rhodopseudomonas sp.]NVN85308.1 molybdopterin molybdotransferase MoeA [Rhodopseudomonas sp.]
MSQVAKRIGAHLPPKSSLSAIAVCDRQPAHGAEALLPIDVARQRGLALVTPVTEVETVQLTDASGRVLGRTVLAETPLPRFDYSAMDGYAVNTFDLERTARPRLTVSGRAAAARVVDRPVLGADAAIRILTGAAIPRGANAVIAQEDVLREGDEIVLSRIPGVGENIRPCGEEAQIGDVLANAGGLIGPAEMGMMASAGCAAIMAFRKIRVATFSTGSELRQPGEQLAPGEIYNSNRFMLRGLLDKPWIELIDLGACPDDPEALSALLRQAAWQADFVMTTGGVSVGDEDHMVETVRRCGGTIAVSKIAIKPGKPLTLGTVGEAIYIGLPGNPGAVFTTFKVLVDELLRVRAGLGPTTTRSIPAIANFSWTGRPGRASYLPAVLEGYNENAAALINLLPKSNSGMLRRLGKADGFVIIAADRETVKPGDLVEWLPL